MPEYDIRLVEPEYCTTVWQLQIVVLFFAFKVDFAYVGIQLQLCHWVVDKESPIHHMEWNLWILETFGKIYLLEYIIYSVDKACWRNGTWDCTRILDVHSIWCVFKICKFLGMSAFYPRMLQVGCYYQSYNQEHKDPSNISAHNYRLLQQYSIHTSYLSNC